MTWKLMIEKGMRECGLNKVDSQDFVKWRTLVWEHHDQPTGQMG